MDSRDQTVAFSVIASSHWPAVADSALDELKSFCPAIARSALGSRLRGNEKKHTAARFSVSGAKQSSSSYAPRRDCRVASLLAMTCVTRLPWGAMPGRRAAAACPPHAGHRCPRHSSGNPPAGWAAHASSTGCTTRQVFFHHVGTLEQRLIADHAVIGSLPGIATPHRRSRFGSRCSRHRRNSAAFSRRLSLQSRALRSVISTPVMAKCSGMRPARARFHNAAINRRRVRSPLAPKITIAHGLGGGARRRVRWAHQVGFLSRCAVHRSVPY